MSKMDTLSEIFADWIARKIDSNEAMYRIHKLFPRITLREWRKRNPAEKEDEIVFDGCNSY